MEPFASDADPPAPRTERLAHGQERLLHLQAGTELHCLAGRLRLQAAPVAGPGFAPLVPRLLGPGGAVRLSEAAWLQLAADGQRPAVVQWQSPARRATKSRQGRGGFWRRVARTAGAAGSWFAAYVRRGWRAA